MPWGIFGWTRHRTGWLGESVAAGFLEARGYRVVERNVRTRFGEIDLVCRAAERGSTHPWLFVEVRTLRSRRFGHPVESLSSAKWRRLHRLALAYLAARGAAGEDYRLDAVTVQWPAGTCRPRVRHWPGPGS